MPRKILTFEIPVSLIKPNICVHEFVACNYSSLLFNIFILFRLAFFVLGDFSFTYIYYVFVQQNGIIVTGIL